LLKTSKAFWYCQFFVLDGFGLAQKTVKVQMLALMSSTFLPKAAKK
jgi:hypothetical protein